MKGTVETSRHCSPQGLECDILSLESLTLVWLIEGIMLELFPVCFRPLFCGESEVDQLGKIFEWVLGLARFWAPLATSVQDHRAAGPNHSRFLDCSTEWLAYHQKRTGPQMSRCHNATSALSNHRPIADFVPEISHQGTDLLLVRQCCTGLREVERV